MYVAQKLNLADADEKHKDKFFADARLPAAECATLEDYKHSGWSRGHMAPAGDMPTEPGHIGISTTMPREVPGQSVMPTW